ncbi:MAG: DNA-3-methyladenine glycosylase family protein, partial [Polyangiaceae bacterium]
MKQRTNPPQASRALNVTKALAHLSEKDRRLAALIGRTRRFRIELKHAQTAFHALAESIVYQQLNGKAAATIFG